MREIKFRQWISKNKQMEYGAGIVKDGHWQGFSSVCFNDDPIMQFTGLKDRDDKEIYEGDIISLINPYDDVETKDFARVVFSQGYVGGWVATVNDKDFLNIGTRTKNVIVVGNIYENPELLA